VVLIVLRRRTSAVIAVVLPCCALVSRSATTTHDPVVLEYISLIQYVCSIRDQRSTQRQQQ
jgi:hypothetical protein